MSARTCIALCNSDLTLFAPSTIVNIALFKASSDLQAFGL
jgi:hypothetical protein